MSEGTFCPQQARTFVKLPYFIERHLSHIIFDLSRIVGDKRTRELKNYGNSWVMHNVSAVQLLIIKDIM